MSIREKNIPKMTAPGTTRNTKRMCKTMPYQPQKYGKGQTVLSLYG